MSPSVSKSVVPIVAAIAIVCGAWLPGYAQNPAVTDALNWLETNQDDISGLWNAAGATPYRDGAVAVEAIGKVDATSATIDPGLVGLDAVPTQSTDFLARRVIAFGAAGAAPSQFLDDLVARQSSLGGWGFDAGFGCNMLETALALQALSHGDGDYNSAATVAIGYLATSQNADGGWGFTDGDSSDVYYTSRVMLALAAWQGTFDVSVPMGSGATWLSGQPHGDGGFGSSVGSTAWETALALMALAAVDPVAVAVTNAATHLETTQSANGSWDDDAYETALAMCALQRLEADPAVFTTSISFSNPTPTDSELVTISASIRNLGATAVSNVLVRFFDGDPNPSGDEIRPQFNTQIGSDVTIPSIPGAGSVIVQADWFTLGYAGDQEIFVQIDPLETITEPNELNNVAPKPVHVFYPPDVLVADDGIVFDPPFPDAAEPMFIRTTVKNTGELTATSISLQVYNGDPDSGGTPLMGSPFIISSIAPGSQFTLNLNMGSFFSVDGAYDIHACTDLSNTIREISETNNCNNQTLYVGNVVQTRSIPLCAGLNLVGFPLVPLSPVTSYSMIPDIPNCNELSVWDRQKQCWMSAIDLGGSNFLGYDAVLDMQDGFFARTAISGQLDVLGSLAAAAPCTDLEVGLNVVSITDELACYSGYTLIDDVTDGVESHAWDCGTQSYLSAEKTGPGTFTGDDFPTTPGYGYFVGVNTAAQWCSHDCDTIVLSLPDLVINPSDLSFGINPTVGVEVFVGSAMHNTGTDTAFAPALSLYAGDPSAGGQLIFTSPLPVDIPPGGTTGPWGVDVIFPSPGSFEIFALADEPDLIAELDENNNQASDFINVTAAVSAAPWDAEDGVTGVSGMPGAVMVFSVEWRAYDLGATTFAVSAKPRGRGSAAAATAISLLTLGNLTSSAATVAWVTDSVSDGCVNYGPTTALGSTMCDPVASEQIHIVDLTGLAPGTTYFYEVVSDTITDDNGGAYYSFATAPFGAGVPFVVHGSVLDSSGAPAPNVRVALLASRGDSASLPLLTETDINGRWLLNLGNLKHAAGGNVFDHADGDSVFITARSGDRGDDSTSMALSGESPLLLDTLQLAVVTCSCPNQADVAPLVTSGDGVVDLLDVVEIINFVFRSGPVLPTDVPLCPRDRADVAPVVTCGDGAIDLLDVVYVIEFVFRSGPPVCDPCGI